MSKFGIIALAYASISFVSPALATGNNETPAQLECTDSAMANMNTKIMTIKDQKMKQSAMDEMTAAGTAMKAKNKEDCIKRMNNAMKWMGSM